MEDSILGVKELYDIVLKATNTANINGRTFLEGEPIVRFDKISIANLNERKTYQAAKGGNGNKELVLWEESQSLNIQFNQGVFSTKQLSFLIDAKIAEQSPNLTQIPMHEELESDENNQIELKYVPMQEQLFIYNKLTGVRITNYTLNNKIITLGSQYLEVIIDYYTMYNNKTTLVKVGLPIANTFFRLEGKTRLKDDNTGNIVTGILIIPRLKLKTGLSIQLGNSSAPMVGTFYGEGFPVGRKGHSECGTLIVLSEDIDNQY